MAHCRRDKQRRTRTARHVVSCATLLFATFLSACTKPYSTPVIEPASPSFPGIYTSMRQADGTEQPVDVISIHGMCTHEKKWVQTTVNRLTEHLDLPDTLIGDPDDLDSAQLWSTVLKNSTGRELVRHYAIVWSPITQPKKRTLCADNSEHTKACPQDVELKYDRDRASLNAELKNKLLNDCLSDAIIYLGPEGAVIREAIRQAIERIGDKRKSTFTRPLFLISESLGSKILVDALDKEPRAERKRDLLAELTPLQQIFMAANQIPLLRLAEGPKTQTDTAINSIDDLARQVEKQRARAYTDRGLKALPTEGVTIVAFTDPNDLLSYELHQKDTVNVIFSNAWTVFDTFENPWVAHRGYLDAPEIWALIVCGSAGGTCR